jgi:hypothetical protein
LKEPLLLQRLKKPWRRAVSNFQVSYPSFSNFTLGREQVEYKQLVRWVKKTAVTWEQTTTLFIHIPKCGGTSTLAALEGNDFRVFYSHRLLMKSLQKNLPAPRILSLDHMLLDVLVESELLGQRTLSSLESFTIVRNPWSRLVSSYRHHKGKRLPSSTSFSHYVNRIIGNVWETRFKNEVGLSHAQPAHHWVKPVTWSGPKTILHLEVPEEIQEYLRRTCQVYSPIPKLNVRSQNRELDCYCLSEELEREVIEWFRLDFEIGGYQTARPANSSCARHG